MKKILIVEDETTISLELQKLLQNSGYEATILKDFTNSKENILKEKADLILLDINLPKINGEILLKEIRKKSNVPIIMLTSRNGEIVFTYLLANRGKIVTRDDLMTDLWNNNEFMIVFRNYFLNFLCSNTCIKGTFGI